MVISDCDAGGDVMPSEKEAKPASTHRPKVKSKMLLFPVYVYRVPVHVLFVEALVCVEIV